MQNILPAVCASCQAKTLLFAEEICSEHFSLSLSLTGMRNECNMFERWDDMIRRIIAIAGLLPIIQLLLK